MTVKRSDPRDATARTCAETFVQYTATRAASVNGNAVRGLTALVRGLMALDEWSALPPSLRRLVLRRRVG
jgi:hypothetical protein